MGFFNRRSTRADVNTATSVGNEQSTRKIIMEKRDGRYPNASTPQVGAMQDSGTPSTRPSFGQWLKGTWLDTLTMAVMGAIGLVVWQAHPAPSRSFPIYSADGQVVYPEFAYPLRNEIIPTWLGTLLAALIPVVVILLAQLRIRSFWDFNNAITGLQYSLITAAVFQVILKCLIGGLRPHFLDVCKPAVTAPGQQGSNGFGMIMYDRKVCTGDETEIDKALESFPSGHSTAAFAGFVYLSLYLNAKLKVFANYQPAFWKLFAIYAPVLGATLIAGALTIDKFHNWYDVLAGGIIGTVMAFSAYRMVYAAVWDFRFNHIPLARDLPFAYGDGPAALDGCRGALFTRRAGWGSSGSGAFGGAPGDSGSGPRDIGGRAAEAAAGLDGATDGYHRNYRGSIRSRDALGEGAMPSDAYQGRRSMSGEAVGGGSPVAPRAEQMV